MRLIWIEVEGFRRFGDRQRLEVGGPLTAIVGPNEAGKTSLFDVIRRFDDREQIDPRDRTRRRQFADEHVVASALFWVEPDDRAAIAHLNGADESIRARFLKIHKRMDGEVTTSLHEGLKRDRTTRKAAQSALSKLFARRSSLFSEREEDDVLNSVAVRKTAELLAQDVETLPGATTDELSRVSDALEAIDDDLSKDAAKAIREVLRSERQTHPNREARNILYRRTPDFLWFGSRERDLGSDYDLALVASDPPPALANLAQLAELDLEQLLEFMGEDNSGEIVEQLTRANERLAAAFSSWSQGAISVRFDQQQGTIVRLHVSNPNGTITRLDERSDGLKMYVALLALSAYRSETVPPIVLIDEVERHLHYDAQADLVQVFANQQALPQIIFSTHSAGCLPEDVGGGVRIVSPIDASGHSEIHNRFWTIGHGFTPLLVGMGASTLAFVPMRNAVLSEGASEVILLPSLLREALETKAVGYQIAPASSEAPAAQIGGLDLSGPRVAWAVDGDAGGDRLRARLRNSDVPEARIVQLGGVRSNFVLEDILAPQVYADAVNDELERSGISERLPTSVVKGRNRPALAKRWLESRGLELPAKTAVAYRALERSRAQQTQLTDARGRKLLIQFDTKVRTVFKMPARD